MVEKTDPTPSGVDLFHLKPSSTTSSTYPGKVHVKMGG
jgi:hypothetical protein